MVNKLERGSWALMRAFSKVSDLEKRRRERNQSEKGVLAKDSVPFEPPTTIVSMKAAM